eukprot:XP_011665834.1 PREDICTED: mucin-2 isoform X2 [Strongylocentrotus purpuratus]
MYPFYDFNSLGSLEPQPDDIAGIQALYGVKCGAPLDGTNTESVLIDEGSPGVVYNYTCISGYTADPLDLLVVCEQNNTAITASWSPGPPICTSEMTTPVTTAPTIEMTTPVTTAPTTEMTTPVTTAPTTEMTTPVTTAPTIEMTTPVTTAPTTEMTTPVTTAPTTEMTTPVTTAPTTEMTTPVTTAPTTEMTTPVTTAPTTEMTTPVTTAPTTEMTTPVTTAPTTEMTTPVTTAPTTEMTTPVTTAPTTEMTTPVTTAPTTEMTTPVTTAPTTEMITAPPPKNELVCKGVRSYIKCDEGLIHIVSAVWGRTDTEPACGKTSEERNCELDVIEYLAPLCENEPSCDFKPKGSLFGGSTENPCDGVKKYLNFTYTCEEEATTTMQPTTMQPTTTAMQPTTTTMQPTTTAMQPTVPPATIMTPVCQGTFGTIDCGLNNVVICSAYYGRNNNIICPSGQANTASSCFEDVTDILQNQRCKDRTKCYPYAVGAYNGNKCASNPQAYLEVTYACAPEGCTEPETLP